MSPFSATAFGVPIADLYQPFDEGMVQAVTETVKKVKTISPDAASILDLGSGPGEPGCTLAAHFPSAAVVCSDVAQTMVDRATARARDMCLANVTAMVLDLSDLTPIPAASQDVVTANFAIMSTASLASALREIHRVLKPGGSFVGTIWHAFSVPLLANAVMTELLGRAPEPPAVDPMRPTITDPALLDAELSKAGLHASEGHNTLRQITFDLGSLDGSSAWKSVMISHLATLEAMEASDAATQAKAQAAVEKSAVRRGLIQDGRLQCPGTYRVMCLAKPLAPEEPATAHSLFAPLSAGALKLAHRVVLAPMTRIRATATSFSPTEDTADYYAQRATEGGLLISEATHVSPEGTPIWAIYPAVADGSYQVPGIWTAEHVAAWKAVTTRVHEKGALMCCQLLHCGRVAQPDIGHHEAVRGKGFDLPSVSSSAVGIAPMPPASNSANDSSGAGHYTWDKPTAPPRALGVDEIARVIDDYKRAASNALLAGFDAVELHAAHGYLISQFLCDGVNQRTDGYGGPIANRCRLLFEVVRALIDVFGAGRVGVRLSPTSIDPRTGQPSQVYFDCTDSDPEPLYAHAVSGLNALPLAYLLLTEPRCGSLGLAVHEDRGLCAPIANGRFRQLFHGTLIGAGGFTPASAAAAVSRGEYDAVAFGRWFLSNPDLPHRLRTGAPLTVYDRATFYGGGRKGYVDYPDLAGTIASASSTHEHMEQQDIGQTLAAARTRAASRREAYGKRARDDDDDELG